MMERPRPLPVSAQPANVEGTVEHAPPETHIPAPAESELPADVAWLFRRALAAGRIHPLMPLLLRYRREHSA
jgi:hypothetical protein